MYEFAKEIEEEERRKEDAKVNNHDSQPKLEKKSPWDYYDPNIMLDFIGFN